MEFAQGNHQSSASTDAIVHLSRLISETNPFPHIKGLEAGQKHVVRGPVDGMASALEKDKMLDSGDGQVKKNSLSVEKMVKKSAYTPCPSRIVTDQSFECVLCGLKGGRKKDLGDLLMFHQESNAIYTTDLEICMHEDCAHWGVKDLIENKAQWRNKEYKMEDLDSMIMESKTKKCSRCGLNGAFINCEYPGCHAKYHLPCAHSATDVVLHGSVGHLWCPKHTILDSDSEEDKCVSKIENPVYDTDEEFAPGARGRISKQKSRQELNAISKKSIKIPSRSNDVKCAIYRPRTDWQKRGNNLWVKIVPPWWCEQKTVHFANKVFRELFGSGSEVTLVDFSGKEWSCTICSETRNDLRLQYTLKGEFQEFWDRHKVGAGDVLTFEKDTNKSNRLLIKKHQDGKGFEDLFYSKPKSRNKISHQQKDDKHPCSEQRMKRRLPDTMAKKTNTESPWIENNGMFIKVIHLSNLVKMNCVLPDWVHDKISSSDLCSSQTTAVFDPEMEKHFVFDINQGPDGKMISGTGFVSWITEKSLSPEDALYLTLSPKGILIGKVPSEPQRKRLCNNKTFTRSKPVDLDTLADAAHYARAHGTPGIRAILSYPDEQQNHFEPQENCTVDGKTCLSDCKQLHLVGTGSESKATHQALKRSSQSIEGPKAALADVLLMNAQAYHEAKSGMGQTTYAPVQPGSKIPVTSGMNPKMSLIAFAAVIQALAKHDWAPEERQVVGEFRSKFAQLDQFRREMTSFSILQFQENKKALIEIMKGITSDKGQ